MVFTGGFSYLQDKVNFISIAASLSKILSPEFESPEIELD